MAKEVFRTDPEPRPDADALHDLPIELFGAPRQRSKPFEAARSDEGFSTAGSCPQAEEEEGNDRSLFNANGGVHAGPSGVRDSETLAPLPSV